MRKLCVVRGLCNTFDDFPSGGLFEEHPLSDDGFLPRSLENRNFRHTEIYACASECLIQRLNVNVQTWSNCQ